MMGLTAEFENRAIFDQGDNEAQNRECGPMTTAEARYTIKGIQLTKLAPMIQRRVTPFFSLGPSRWPPVWRERLTRCALT